MNREASQSAHATYERILDRRKKLRMPVDMLTLNVDMRGQSSAFVYKADIVNLSRGGVCIEWNCCKECIGYTPGGIHPACIFSPYHDENPDGRDLVFYVTVPWTGETIDFKGRAVYTFKHEGLEQVGIEFTSISEKTLELLECVVKITRDFAKMEMDRTQ